MEVLEEAAKQVPALALFVVVVVYFLRASDKSAERQAEKDRVFSETIKQIGESCHTNQQNSILALQDITNRYEAAMRDTHQLFGEVSELIRSAKRENQSGGS